MKNKVMKSGKCLMMAGLLLAVVWTSEAQKFNGGIMAGIVASQVAGDTYSGFNKAGIFAGGFVRYDFFRGKTSIQMELAYFQKGSRHNSDSKDPSTYIFRASYVEVPVLVQYKFAKRFKAEAGPSVGVFINSFEQRDGLNALNVNPSKLTLQISAGLYFYLNQRFRVNFRTNNSLLSIRSKTAPGDVRRFFDWGQYHDCLVLSLYYQFRDDSGRR